jgi:hypothetical protein
MMNKSREKRLEGDKNIFIIYLPYVDGRRIVFEKLRALFNKTDMNIWEKEMKDGFHD